MKRITNFYSPKLSQQQALQFFRKVYEKMLEFEDERFQVLLQCFQSAYMDFDIALKSISSNLITKNIGVENEKRHKALITLKQQAVELLDSSNSLNRSIGNKLNKILLSYDVSEYMNDKEKTSLFSNLLKEIEEEINLQELYELDIYNEISEIKRANWAYDQFVKAREIEVRGACLTYETLRTRKALENSYNKAVEFINAMVIYFGDMEYSDRINQINQIIDEADIKFASFVERSIPA